MHGSTRIGAPRELDDDAASTPSTAEGLFTHRRPDAEATGFFDRGRPCDSCFSSRDVSRREDARTRSSGRSAGRIRSLPRLRARGEDVRRHTRADVPVDGSPLPTVPGPGGRPPRKDGSLRTRSAMRGTDSQSAGVTHDDGSETGRRIVSAFTTPCLLTSHVGNGDGSVRANPVRANARGPVRREPVAGTPVASPH